MVIWAALEYTDHVQENGIQGKPLVIAAIVYTNKSKCRSSVIMESVLFVSSAPLTAFRFGKPITMDAYKEEFCSSSEGAPRAAVKRLTKAFDGTHDQRARLGHFTMLHACPETFSGQTTSLLYL